MYLRSSSKKSPNKLNVSRGRGRGVCSSPNRSLSDLHSSATSRSPVIHSPPRSASAPLAKLIVDSSNIHPPILHSPTRVSSQSVVNVNVASGASDNDRTLEENFIEITSHSQDREHILDKSLSQTTTLLGFNVGQPTVIPPTIMTSAGYNESLTQIGTSEDTMNTDNLMAVLRSIRETHLNFSAELSSLRATVSTLTQSTSSSRERANPVAEGDQVSSDPTQNLNTARDTSVRRSKIDLEKWKIHFDGSGNVTDFLFKIDTLVDRTQCTFEQLEANFQIFLSGNAEFTPKYTKCRIRAKIGNALYDVEDLQGNFIGIFRASDLKQ